jgi:hypothetical protein
MVQESFMKIEPEEAAATVRMAHAKPGEFFLTNDTIHPDEVGKSTRTGFERACLARHPELKLRFDYKHVVNGFGTEYSGREFAEKVSCVKSGEGVAVYAKPKGK